MVYVWGLSGVYFVGMVHVFSFCGVYGNKWSPVDVYGIYVVCGVCAVHV